ncbi:MAG: MFS transporter [Rhodospirillales bacterium]|nr:MAG: MFS transporter [Rhodospirillales bacterium]
MNRGAAVIAAMCAANVLTMIGVFAYPALLPTFVTTWDLTNTEAGWIAGIFFAGYAVGVPVLVALTDRHDARTIYLAGAVLAVAASAGFALLAAGFWSALAFRALAGLALSATFMPGLRVLIDRYQGPRQSRAVALYTASFSLGTALSFLAAGEAATAFGWPAAFAIAAAAAGIAAVIVLLLPPVQRERRPSDGWLLDFRPVFANRGAMGFILGYGVHCWELFALRSWMVAFLAFALALPSSGTAGGTAPALAPTMVATISGLIAMAASIAGNEFCVRFGRRLVIRRVMLASSLTAFGIGFSAGLPYLAVAALMLAYTALVQFDSAAFTAGAVAAAEPNRQGATMAVHSLIGFGGGFIGPLVFGWSLDLTGGGDAVVSWGVAFALVGAIGLLGPLALRLVPTAPPARRS